MPRLKLENAGEYSPEEVDMIRAAHRGEGYGKMGPAETKKRVEKIKKDVADRLAKKPAPPKDEDVDFDDDEEIEESAPPASTKK